MFKVNIIKVAGVISLSITILGMTGCGSDESTIREVLEKIDKEVVPKAVTMKRYSNEEREFFKQHCNLVEPMIKIKKKYLPKNVDEFINNPNADKLKEFNATEKKLKEEYCDKYKEEDKNKEKCYIMDRFILNCSSIF